MSGIRSFSCHVLASLDIVSDARTNLGTPLTFEACCISLTPKTVLGICLLFLACSFCVFAIFWSAGTAISVKIHSLSSFPVTGKGWYSWHLLCWRLLVHICCLFPNGPKELLLVSVSVFALGHFGASTSYLSDGFSVDSTQSRQ